VDLRHLHADHGDGVVLVTGATGLLGTDLVRRWTIGGMPRRIAVLVRDRARWQTIARHAGLSNERIVVLEGDVTVEGLGLPRHARAWLAGHATAIVHLAADTTYSRPLDEARRVNRDGTAHLLALAADFPQVERFAHVSTAFVTGRRTGFLPETPDSAATDAIGWVNAYERSKAEAEALVRAARRDWVILRSSTIACDDATGAVTQRNAIHQALRLFHDGLAAMIPGLPDSMLDVVTTDYVSDGLARLALRDGIGGATVHLCAGTGAMPLDEVLDECRAFWATDPVWRRRGIARPAQADLETWELFAQAVEETGHPRLRRVTRALGHFLPQLALPKRFDTRVADALLGAPSPPVREYWGRMIGHLLHTGWRGVPGLGEAAA
jgi:long-chain acyl-CoA synthetase